MKFKKKVDIFSEKWMVARKFWDKFINFRADISYFFQLFVLINNIIVKVFISNKNLQWKVISAWEKILEAGDCLEAFFQETRADPGIVSSIQWSVRDFFQILYG